MRNLELVQTSKPFLSFLEAWVSDLPTLSLTEFAAEPQNTAIVSVDVINGFCVSGALASPRVAGIVDPIVNLFKQSWSIGVDKIILVQDTHEPDAVEFQSWPPHCVRGTAEAETVAEFKQLPFYDRMVTFEKNSIHAGQNTGLNEWIIQHPTVDHFIVVGDCTDLCTYQLAMHLLLEGGARQVKRRVIVPENCVETYDRTVETAQEQGGFPHPADLMHAVFLYHMALNGVEVVRSLT
jgi:nicotinamidase-related amidase